MRPLTAASVATLLLLTGCAADVSDKAVAIGLSEEQTRVEQTAVEVADALRGAGIDVPEEGTSRYRACDDQPGPSVDLTVGFALTGTAGTAARVERLREALGAAGWVAGDADSLRRGDLRVLLTDAGRSVAVGVTGECVEAEEGRVGGLLRERTAVDLG